MAIAEAREVLTVTYINQSRKHIDNVDSLPVSQRLIDTKLRSLAGLMGNPAAEIDHEDGQDKALCALAHRLMGREKMVREIKILDGVCEGDMILAKLRIQRMALVDRS